MRNCLERQSPLTHTSILDAYSLMSFTSLEFIFFLIAVVAINYCIPKRYRWIFLLAASCYFYINWQPIYVILLFITSVSTYIVARILSIENMPQSNRKITCIIGCLLPLFSLVIFKYYNFITDSVSSALNFLGIGLPMPTMKLLLPIGISFYTFTAVGYLIDLYKRKYSAEKNFGILCLFIAYFAQIASGPIPRGNSLIPQLKNPESLSYDNVIGGLRTMLWGFFMKLCVADRLGIYVDAIYGNLEHHNGGSLFLASLFYTIQIYCDFGGYSLVAIGASRMLGIKLMENFKRPYFSSSIKEFWSRWHISLSTWFRDYVYIPMGGNRVSRKRNAFNLIVTFLVSGLWHGAAWNFLLWGGLHGVGQVAEKNLTLRNKTAWPSFIKICFIFIVINFLWVFFRLQNVNDIKNYFVKIITDLGMPFVDMMLVYGVLAISILFIKDLIDEYFPKIKLMGSDNFYVSNVATGVLVCFILLFGVFDSSSFIYFQF